MKTNDISPTLKLFQQNLLFSGMSQEDLIRLCQAARQRAFEKGQFLALQGENWPYLFLVASGRIDAIKESVEGRRLVVRSLKKGDVFWGLAFFDDQEKMSASLEAKQRGEVIYWNQETLLPVLMKNPAALWKLDQLIIHYIQETSKKVDLLAFQPVTNRLAHFILDNYGDQTGQTFSRDLTLDEMAAKVGTTREQVSRILNRFADEGLIHITRTEFEITRPEGLARLAKE